MRSFFLFFSVMLLPFSALARDEIRAVGSSTVFPFVTVVAEEFGQKNKFPYPCD